MLLMPAPPDEAVHRSPIRLKGLSIQQRLPLLICGLLLSMIVIFCWISYQGVKRTAIKSGKDRLQALTTQLSSMFAQTMQTTAAITRTTVNQPFVKNYLKGNITQRDSITALLERMRQD